MSTSQTRPLALSRQIEGDADDALDLGLGIDFGVDPAAAAVRHCLDAARLAEIDAAGQLAHDHQIEAGDELALQARRVGQRLEHHRRAQIGEQVHLLAQPQDAALGPQLERQACPISAPPTAPNSTASLATACARVASVSGTPGFIEGGAADQTLG